MDRCICRWCLTSDLTQAMLSPPLCSESPGDLKTRRHGVTRWTRGLQTLRYSPEPRKTRRARVRSVRYVPVWCSSEAPNHLRRTLVNTRPDACAPRKCRRWLRCGTVAAESPAPATSCRHTGQMCCSDMLHILRGRLVAAERMLTVLSSADTRTTQNAQCMFDHRGGEARAGIMRLQQGC